MMLIKLFLFFLVLLILPDMYIYKAYIRRVSQKWTHWAYWLPSLFLLLGMTLFLAKANTRKQLASQSVSFIGNDISLFYTRATSGFHAAT